jgi:hypothetical protein
MKGRRRFFSGVYERLSLLISAGGVCQQCGVRLDKWHADHIVPFSLGGETDLENGRALCPPCNLKKGSNMIDLNDRFKFTVNGREYDGPKVRQIPRNQMREGQLGALFFDLEVIRYGKRPDGTEAKAISNVLPPGYGKSDIIRTLAIYSRGHGFAGALVLSPGLYLRSQITSAKKVREMVERHQWNPRVENLFGEIKSTEEIVVGALEKLVLGSATIQMLGNSNLTRIENLNGKPPTSKLRSTMELAQTRMGGRLLVMIDEGHECGDERRRGEMVSELLKAGCFVILFTATPYRSDGDIIPGMRSVELSSAEINRSRAIGEDLENNLIEIEVTKQDKIRHKLIPDYEITFAQAWKEQTEEGKPILCGLNLQTIDIEFDDGSKLSELIHLETKLPRVSVIKERLRGVMKGKDRHKVFKRAAHLFVADVFLRRRTWAKSAGLVYTGNDLGFDEVDNLPKEMAKAIVDQWKVVFGREPSYKIATGNDENAADTIHDFASNGQFDFIVCKQMGGAGLDSNRVKTLLDMSLIRTYASNIQRWLRVSRPKYFTQTEQSEVFTGTVITIKDPINLKIWGDVITAEGGDKDTATEYLTDPVVVDTYWKDKEEPKTKPDSPEFSQVLDGGIHDHNSVADIDPDDERRARNLTNRYPHLFSHITIATMARSMKVGGTQAGREKPKKSSKKSKPKSASDIELQDLKNALNKAIKVKSNECGISFDPPEKTHDERIVNWQNWVRGFAYINGCRRLGRDVDGVAVDNGYMSCPRVSFFEKKRDVELINAMLLIVSELRPITIATFKNKVGGK